MSVYLVYRLKLNKLYNNYYYYSFRFCFVFVYVYLFISIIQVSVCFDIELVVKDITEIVFEHKLKSAS